MSLAVDGPDGDTSRSGLGFWALAVLRKRHAAFPRVSFAEDHAMAATFEDRFESHVDRGGVHHLWLGAINPSRGTGRLKVDGRQVTAHRHAWELANAPLDPGQRVLACPDEPACVRLDHLRLEEKSEQPDGRRADAPEGPPRRRTRGGGSIRQRGPGRWEISVTTGADEAGRPVRSFRTVRGTESEATKALALFVAEVTETGPVVIDSVAGHLTVDRLLEEFLHHLEGDKGRQPATVLRYAGLQQNWIRPHLGAMRADRILPNDIDSVLGRLRQAGQSQSSIHQTFTLLNGAFRWARRNRRVPSNPCAEVEEPRSSSPAREVLPPELETIQRLVEAAFELEFGFGVACYLAAVTGMRRGEICGLRWPQVHLDEGYLVVTATVGDVGGKTTVNEFTKTRKTRRVSIDQRCADLLRQLRTEADNNAATADTALVVDSFVFTHSISADSPLRPELFSRRMARLRRSLGMEHANFDTTMHSLRHWTQTALSEAGYNSRQVALRGGHSEQLMNRVYVHRTNTAERQMTDYLGDLLNPTE